MSLATPVAYSTEPVARFVLTYFGSPQGATDFFIRAGLHGTHGRVMYFQSVVLEA